VRGFAHVLKEDPANPKALFLGTEFGLWISVDGGSTWAAFKPGNLPNVPVRDLAFQQRDHDLVIATHGRGLWIVDDLTPLGDIAALSPESDATFLKGRPVRQRIESSGGWSTGDAVFIGNDPADGAVISYYLRSRRVIGKITLELLDSSGAVGNR
jgi:hypothetical protein